MDNKFTIKKKKKGTVPYGVLVSLSLKEHIGKEENTGTWESRSTRESDPAERMSWSWNVLYLTDQTQCEW